MNSKFLFSNLPSPLPPEADQRGESKEISPFGKGGLRGILQTLYNIIFYVSINVLIIMATIFIFPVVILRLDRGIQKTLDARLLPAGMTDNDNC
ncbi:MAG: hypothetical protein A2Y81_01110 [Nitrospirae bacterium RBG_13_43_8]|nr:MAG: hypothetical protein A2Y81_01110 [Nitrospirae bacterium RBG_13_43_8]